MQQIRKKRRDELQWWLDAPASSVSMAAWEHTARSRTDIQRWPYVRQWLGLHGSTDHLCSLGFHPDSGLLGIFW
uniref:Uncharacterized protein n=1 Tax=Manihot esculenta TaxID=3983 RepID=A0A2C9URY9_MANES